MFFHSLLVLSTRVCFNDLNHSWNSSCPYCRKNNIMRKLNLKLLETVAQYSMILQVHKIVDLSEQPDREAMWNLEVIEAHKLFYLSSPE